MGSPMDLEHELHVAGHQLVAGADETGRGAWAGPMFAAAVILPSDFDPNLDPEIEDSKDMSPHQREEAYSRILEEAIAISVCWVTAAEVDRAQDRGEYDACNAGLLHRAILALSPRPQYALVDSMDVPDLPLEHRRIDHGEAASASIAAASVVAKVARDRMMVDLGHRFPEWGFEDHKGYGGGDGSHAAALAKHGTSPIHRLSSKGVRRNVDPAT